MWSFTLAAMMGAASIEAIPPKEDVAGSIQRLEPRMSAARAAELGSWVEKWSAKYQVQPTLLVAIMMQETGFVSGAKVCYVVHRYASCQVTCDYGVAQVNQLWIEKWKLDAERLQYDDSYNIRIAARILAGLHREFGEGDLEWFGRYHSGTPSKKAIYLGKLKPILAQL